MRANKVLLLSLLLALHPVAFAQDDPEPEESEAADAIVDEEPPAEQEADEVFETDDEAYIDIDEEDFVPTEEIPTDQSIPFPTDI